MYIGIIVFRLLKHSDELYIKTPTLLGDNTFTGGRGARPYVPPPAGYGLFGCSQCLAFALHHCRQDLTELLQVVIPRHILGAGLSYGRL